MLYASLGGSVTSASSVYDDNLAKAENLAISLEPFIFCSKPMS